MNKVIEVINTRIHCDGCQDEFEVMRSEVPNYHNVPCEKCGQILIDDDDMKVFDATTKFMNTVNDAIGDVGEGAVYQKVTLNSAEVKNND